MLTKILDYMHDSNFYLMNQPEYMLINTWLHKGVEGLAQQSVACLGWKLTNPLADPEHQEAQTTGVDPPKAPVAWW